MFEKPLFEKFRNECDARVKDAAEKFEALVNGHLYDVEGEDTILRTPCINSRHEDGIRQISVSEFMDRYPDFQFITDGKLNYQHGRLYLCEGGPSVWIDTEARCMKLSWNTFKAQWGLSEKAVAAADEWFEEVYRMSLCGIRDRHMN